MTMTKAGHYLSPIDFPVYALCFIDDHTVALAGGGGAGRSGVKNCIASGLSFESAQDMHGYSNLHSPYHTVSV